MVEVDVSPAAYDDWHIDGAVLWNIYTDLKDTDYQPVDPTGAGGAAGALGDHAGLDGRLLRLRPRPWASG